MRAALVHDSDATVAFSGWSNKTKKNKDVSSHQRLKDRQHNVCLFWIHAPALQHWTHLRTCLQNVSHYTTLIPKASASLLWKKFKTALSGMAWHEPDYVLLWLEVTANYNLFFLEGSRICCTARPVQSDQSQEKPQKCWMSRPTLLRTHANYLIQRVNP